MLFLQWIQGAAATAAGCADIAAAENDAPAIASAISMDLKLVMLLSPVCIFARSGKQMTAVSDTLNAEYVKDRDGYVE